MAVYIDTGLPKGSYGVSGLAAKTVCCFKVCAECETGVSPDSEMSDPIVTSPPPAPSQPGKPTAFESDIQHNSILLQWAKVTIMSIITLSHIGDSMIQ